MRTRFAYKIKRTADNKIERCKTRQVAKGFSQRPGIDFFETFSPVVGFDTIRTVLASEAFQGLEVGLLDFKQAYLNASLQENIWLELPDGRIVKANKAIYRLQ
ncbi:unnamed protein product [Discosporangium mesarthrocarpum]